MCALAGNHTAKLVADLVRPYVEQLGLTLWDVRFVKEGASWYLRIFIDKEGGVTIDDCTDVSHAVDPVLDEADPISVSYYLEVCSPGLERELKEPEHFLAFVGSEISLTLYKAENGLKSVKGILKSFEDNTVALTVDGELKEYPLSAVAKATLCDLD
ncbi:MAG: ribosome maturation factor RimP [Clostridia bacterium]|nr:ribosome maturation factor RimP [Clostridia bacterium]